MKPSAPSSSAVVPSRGDLVRIRVRCIGTDLTIVAKIAERVPISETPTSQVWVTGDISSYFHSTRRPTPPPAPITQTLLFVLGSQLAHRTTLHRRQRAEVRGTRVGENRQFKAAVAGTTEQRCITEDAHAQLATEYMPTQLHTARSAPSI